MNTTALPMSRVEPGRSLHAGRASIAGLARLTLLALSLAAGSFSAAAQTADAARAVAIVEASCSVCHGSDGESASPAFPRLAGQHAGYIERQLRDYKSGRRKSRAMSAIIEDVPEADFAVLGRYFQSRPTHTHPVEDAELAQVGRYLFTRGNPYSGVPACTACHGENGAGTDKLPRLAGQHARYIERQLQAFDKRERTNDNAVMHGIASKLTELELRALAAYVSGLR